MPETRLDPPAMSGKRPTVEKLTADLLLRLFGNASRPILIAIGGPGGTGKTAFARRLAQALDGAAILALDHYKTSRHHRQQAGIYGAHPEANKMDLIARHLRLLRRNRHFDQPIYCSTAGEASETRPYHPGSFNLIEGEVATYGEFRELVDFSIYIDADWKTQLNTRLTRDIEQRGYSPEKAIATFLHSNLREFDKYGKDSKKWADMRLFCDSDYRLRIEAVSPPLLDHLQEFLTD